MYADPVKAVKQSYCNPAVAAEYRGRHMSLALAEMHERYVSKTNRILAFFWLPLRTLTCWVSILTIKRRLKV